MKAPYFDRKVCVRVYIRTGVATVLGYRTYIYVRKSERVKMSYLSWLSIYTFKKVAFTLFGWVFVCIRSSLHSVCFGQLLPCAHKRIVNIMKVYVERKNTQVELIPFRNKYRLYSRVVLRGEEFNATRVFRLG